MLFEGFGLHLTPPPDNVEGHPFHAKNNVNGIGISSIVDYMTLPLDSKVRDLQEDYIGKVLDTLHDLPNVLYEVANEASGQDADGFEMAGQTIPGRIGDTTAWQYWVIETVKRLERERGYDARTHRHDHAVPGAGPAPRERAAVRQPCRLDLTRL